MNKTELKPCPFCGASGNSLIREYRTICYLVDDPYNPVYCRKFYIECKNCGARGKNIGAETAREECKVNLHGEKNFLIRDFEFYHEKSAEAWNRRNNDA